MIDKIAYSVNKASAPEIAAHLLHADVAFEPILSNRVDIEAYSHKLHDRAVCFEAWLDGELIGLVAVYCNQIDGDKAFVTSVSVWHEFYGRGIAAQLMRQCIEHVRGLGFGQIELEVGHRNLSAISLYQKLGFNTIYIKDPTLTMRMILRGQTI